MSVDWKAFSKKWDRELNAHTFLTPMAVTQILAMVQDAFEEDRKAERETASAFWKSVFSGTGVKAPTEWTPEQKAAMDRVFKACTEEPGEAFEEEPDDRA